MSGGASFDAVVVGAGHNGLVCAAYLAKARRKVLVLEAADEVGGAAVSRAIHPGYTVSRCAHILHHLHPRVAADLGLARHGLSLTARDLATVALLPDGEHLLLSGDATATRDSLARFSPSDAERLPRFQARLSRLAAALRPFLARTPPEVALDDWSDRWELLRLGFAVRRLGRADMRELFRIIGINAADTLDEAFESDALKGVFAFDSVLGGFLGPRSPNSVFALLYRAAGETAGRRGALGHPKGGMGAVAGALAAAARSFGAELRTGAPVASIDVKDSKAVGVVLESGAEIAASAVVSNADPRRTFFDLVGADHLDTDFARRIGHIRMNGTAAKVNLALGGLPDFNKLGPMMQEARLVVAPSVDFVERAFDDAKYGRVSAEPVMEITIPSLHDPTLAAPGGHVMSVIVQFAPYALSEGSWDERREAFGDRVVEALAGCASDLPGKILAREVLTPFDLEREFRLTGGHWHHGELALDQAFTLRPVPRFARYRAPIDNLYLCGAGCHPGGGVMGAAGANAAREILKDWKEGRLAR
ncbi:MAG: phytoene desaturase family protein [Alphaproteobacteria bacterium]